MPSPSDGLQKLAKECAYFSERFGAGGWWYGADWSIIDVYIYCAYSTAAKGSLESPFDPSGNRVYEFVT